MKKFLLIVFALLLNACTHKYILIDEDFDESDSYTFNDVKDNETKESNFSDYKDISAEDVFVVAEGDDFVTYQYKNVIVSEISPMASLYCDDIAYGKSPYLREVSLFHNGFMRATFDCVDIAI